MAQTILESIGNTPLLTMANFAAGTGAVLLGKQESRNPLGSVKCRIAVSMIEAGEKDGRITRDTTIIEPTSGNTGIGLAFVCAHKKLRLILTMPESMSIERRKLLTHLGAKLVLTPAAEGMKGAIAKAKQLHAETANSYYTRPVQQPGQPRYPPGNHRRGDMDEIPAVKSIFLSPASAPVVRSPECRKYLNKRTRR